MRRRCSHHPSSRSTFAETDRGIGYRRLAAAGLPQLDRDHATGARELRRRTAMRTVTVTAVALALLALPAQAQLNSKRHAGDAQKKTDSAAPKVDEKAYK